MDIIMTGSQGTDDVKAIRAIIDRQFASLAWSSTQEADWPTFAGDFHGGAALYPSARPLTVSTVESFVQRMQGLAQTTLRTFKERTLGAEIRVFGNVAVAMAACELTENGEKVSRGVEAMLLVKDAGRWQIVAQGWDTEKTDNPIPPAFLSG
jgi:hypothetical protein